MRVPACQEPLRYCYYGGQKGPNSVRKMWKGAIPPTPANSLLPAPAPSPLQSPSPSTRRLPACSLSIRHSTKSPAEAGLKVALRGSVGVADDAARGQHLAGAPPAFRAGRAQGACGHKSGGGDEQQFTDMFHGVPPVRHVPELPPVVRPHAYRRHACFLLSAVTAAEGCGAARAIRRCSLLALPTRLNHGSMV